MFFILGCRSVVVYKSRMVIVIMILYSKHSLIESIMFSTNEIEFIEASDLQVIHKSGAGPHR